MTEENGFIVLGKKTQENLKVLNRAANNTLNELKAQQDIIIQSYLDALDKKGNYRISKDFTKLELAKDNPDGSK